jgi:hypothetical protein
LAPWYPDRMRRLLLVGTLVLAAAVTPARATQIEDTRIVPSADVARRIIVQDVQSTSDRVTGTVVNATSQPIRDVRLLVRDDWLWQNERHPGSDNPGRATTVTLRDEIPPGSRVQFTYRRDQPLPARRDGHFDTDVDVLGFVTLSDREATVQ